MICPNMATMLSVVLCDAQVEASVWQKMLRDAVELTFNRVTVDGDTSTNDTLYGLANGASGVSASGEESIKALSAAPDFRARGSGLYAGKGRRGRVQGCPYPCGRGGIRCRCRARGPDGGALAAGKTALYGRDANWGRIVAAVGRSGADFNPDDVVVTPVRRGVVPQGAAHRSGFRRLARRAPQAARSAHRHRAGVPVPAAIRCSLPTSGMSM